MKKEPLLVSERNTIIGIIAVSVIVFGTGFYLNFIKSGGDMVSRILKALWAGWSQWLAPVYIVASLAAIGVGIYCCVRYWPHRLKVSVFEKPSVGAEKMKRKKDPRITQYWEQLVRRANTGTPENLRLAILEADALVDYFLKTSGYIGEHMADRLSQLIGSEVKSLERLWKAHRLRNDIVHTPGYTITPKIAADALYAYRDFLIELDAF